MEASAAAGSQAPSEQPNAAQTVEIGTAMGNAVDPNTQTPEEAQKQVQAAAEKRAQELNIKLHPDALKEMSEFFIGQLESRGAFERKEDESHSSQSVEASSEDGDATEVSTPQNKSWAARFLG